MSDVRQGNNIRVSRVIELDGICDKHGFKRHNGTCVVCKVAQEQAQLPTSGDCGVHRACDKHGMTYYSTTCGVCGS